MFSNVICFVAGLVVYHVLKSRPVQEQPVEDINSLKLKLAQLEKEREKKWKEEQALLKQQANREMSLFLETKGGETFIEKCEDEMMFDTIPLGTSGIRKPSFNEIKYKKKNAKMQGNSSASL